MTPAPPIDVTFTSEGEKLAAHLRPPTTTSNRTLVVFAAGMTLTKEVWLPPWAVALNARGYTTLNFDYRGFGGSGGARLRLVPQQQVVDVENAVTWARAHDGIDRVVVVGVSLGAAVALAVGATVAAVDGFAAVGGPSDLWRVWSALPNFPRFQEKVELARRQYVRDGTSSTMKLSKLLSSDPGTCALIEHDAPLHPTWTPELTFESLHWLFQFRPEKQAATAKKGLFVTCEHDGLIGRVEAVSAWASCPEPKKLVEIKGVSHHEIYGAGAGFQPAIDAIDAWFTATK